MVTESGRILFDACTLENFAIVGRLDLLQALYHDRCAWTDGTELEVRPGLRDQAWLQSLSGASWLQVVADDDAVQQIDRIRRMLGGSSTRPRQHQKMAASGRGVAVPPNCWHICPPSGN